MRPSEPTNRMPALMLMGALSALAAFLFAGFMLGSMAADRSAPRVAPTAAKAAASDVSPSRTAAAQPPPTAPAIDAAAPSQPAAATVAAFEAAPAPGVRQDVPSPLFGPNYKPNDGLPVYVCGIEAAPSYLNLLQIQMSGADIANGFHLGIVPIELDRAPYEIDEDGMRGYMQRGDWDCIIEEIDEVMIGNYGIVTALVDESLGENGIWGRDIPTYYELANKRVAFEEKSSAHFFMLYVLSILPQDVRSTVTLVPFRTADAALTAFAEGRADALSGVGISLVGSAVHGGRPVISSDQLRVIANALVTSRKAVKEKPGLVRAFHSAWFAALKAQTSDYDAAADLIAGWGHHDWTGIPKSNPAGAFKEGFIQIAQADFRDNLNIMRNIKPILSRLELSRQLWQMDKRIVVQDPIETLVDPSFVLALAGRDDLLPERDPINNNFTLASAPPADIPKQTGAAPVVNTPVVATAAAIVNTPTATGPVVITTLPCRRFDFRPDSVELTPDSQETIDRCVLPALQQRATLRLRITGSAAWPAPRGKYSEEQIRAFARERATTIANYLVAQGIDPVRLQIDAIVPPEERRGIADRAQLTIDRFVDMTLFTE